MTPYPPIVDNMKFLRGVVTVAVLAAASAFLTGCGGVSGSHSVSPASLFVPGLMQNDAPRPAAPGEATPAVLGTDERQLPS